MAQKTSQQGGTGLEPEKPIVIESTKKKRKKRYSNRPLRFLQELESGLSKSARKVADAVDEAIETYEDARDKSADRKKDGAFRDMLRNQSRALRKGLPIAAEAPADLLDAVADSKLVSDFWNRKEDDDDDDDDDDRD